MIFCPTSKENKSPYFYIEVTMEKNYALLMSKLNISTNDIHYLTTIDDKLMDNIDQMKENQKFTESRMSRVESDVIKSTERGKHVWYLSNLKKIVQFRMSIFYITQKIRSYHHDHNVGYFLSSISKPLFLSFYNIQKEFQNIKK